jgi:hypothetical protein
MGAFFLPNFSLVLMHNSTRYFEKNKKYKKRSFITGGRRAIFSGIFCGGVFFDRLASLVREPDGVTEKIFNERERIN